MTNRFATTLVLAFSAFTLFAQYPTITPDVQRQADSLMTTFRQASDAAWAQALPIVEAEALKGRPYVPWAHRPYDLLQCAIPAFPGAEGGGAYTPGGRGGKVLVVTSLEDSGPGTLRWACEQGGARIVVFNVAGIIRLKTPISVRAPYITIAGQTAPGDGVCVAGESFWVDTHDVIVRHMRFRRGETWVGRRDDSFGGNPIGNIMLDHISASWGLDENISFYRHMYEDGTGSTAAKLPTVNVTIQNSISSEALDTWNHSFGSTIGGENATFMRNLWANNTGRNPSNGWYGVFNFVNNVVFNWTHRTMDGGDYRAMYNIINNYYKPGPATPTKGPISHRIVKPESGRSKLSYKVYGRVYADGNIMEGFPEITADNWKGGVQVEDQADCGAYTDAMRSHRPFAMPTFPIMNAGEAFDFVLANAGATWPKRDAVDIRVTNTVRTGAINPLKNVNTDQVPVFKYRRAAVDSYKIGVITDISQVGGYPEYKGKPRKDSDGDGMPDSWERRFGLDPKDPSDATKDCNGDGYTNIEKYINGMDPTVNIDWADPANNHDTLAKKKGDLAN
ncbi:MAG: polysaccharide lyase [Bacteroidales bacterium]|jgi:hypothetical protein|nr:polysaccharide lyase [Bacteroidales bacterium]